jgi:hypothetical protein
MSRKVSLVHIVTKREMLFLASIHGEYSIFIEAVDIVEPDRFQRIELIIQGVGLIVRIVFISSYNIIVVITLKV